MRLKGYYSIEEAAKFLTLESGQDITRMDVMMLAMRGDIRLCAWFDGGLLLIKEPLRELEPGDLPYCNAGHAFKGYMQIPLELISPDSKKIYFYPMQIIEAVTQLNNQLPMKVDPPGSFASSNYDKGLDDYFVGCIPADCNDAVIPKEDLLSLMLKNKEAERLCAEKPLTTTERNTLLTIIGLMAQGGYGDVLNKPYSLANEILVTADLLGIKITNETIAKKLQAAKIVLEEKSE